MATEGSGQRWVSVINEPKALRGTWSQGLLLLLLYYYCYYTARQTNEYYRHEANALSQNTCSH